MNRAMRLSLTLSVICQLVFALATVAHAEEQFTLDHATIVAEADQPSFVQYGIEELAGYLKELTGNDVPLASSLKDAKGVRIVVGTKSVAEILAQELSKDQLGEDGYLLRSVS